MVVFLGATGETKIPWSSFSGIDILFVIF
jgi:hypothetical protein